MTPFSTTRRTFLKTATIAGAGYLAAEGNAEEQSASPNQRLGVACIGIGGKGGSDSNNAAAFGNIVAFCDVDKTRLESKGKAEAFRKAKRYLDYREMLEKHEKEIDIVTVSTTDHMHAAQTLMAMRMGKHVYTQKPLTRTIYEARLLSTVAKETGVCTQMGNQGAALDGSRNAIAQLKAGVIGDFKDVYIWSNRPIWKQGPDRRMGMERFAREAYENIDKNLPATKRIPQAENLIWAKYDEIRRSLGTLDWKLWIGTAKYREFYPALYHSFQWRGWWDFGTGALGDMACHHMDVPFKACGLKDPTWVRARSTGHDFDSYPVSSVIEFGFPATEQRGAIGFQWYDREGNTPPLELFRKYGIEKPSKDGTLIVGEKGAFFGTSSNNSQYKLLAEGGGPIEPIRDLKVEYAESRGGSNDLNHMYELFRAVQANDPKLCHSNFIDVGGPMTETMLLGNLAVWAAAKGGPDGSMGDWGEKVEWDAKNLRVTNLSDLKTPGVAELVKPIYAEGYRLD